MLAGLAAAGADVDEYTAKVKCTVPCIYSLISNVIAVIIVSICRKLYSYPATTYKQICTGIHNNRINIVTDTIRY